MHTPSKGSVVLFGSCKYNNDLLVSLIVILLLLMSCMSVLRTYKVMLIRKMQTTI